MQHFCFVLFTINVMLLCTGSLKTLKEDGTLYETPTKQHNPNPAWYGFTVVSLPVQLSFYLVPRLSLSKGEPVNAVTLYSPPV